MCVIFSVPATCYSIWQGSDPIPEDDFVRHLKLSGCFLRGEFVLLGSGVRLERSHVLLLPQKKGFLPTL